MIDAAQRDGRPDHQRSVHQKVVDVFHRLIAWLRSQDKVVKCAWGLGFLQFLLLTLEEVRIGTAGALSADYSVDAGAYGAIGRGDLHPTFLAGVGLYPFLHNHYDFLTWPLAYLLVGILHLPVKWLLLIGLQALPLALIGPVIATYASVRTHDMGVTGRTRVFVVMAPAVLAFLDIWLYWSAQFDYHPEILQGLLMVVGAIALERHRNGVLAAAIVLLALMGNNAGLVLIGLGLTALLRLRWRPAIVMLGIGTLWVVLPGAVLPLASIGAQSLYGSIVPGHHTTVGFVVAFLTHPAAVLVRLSSHLRDVWALVGAAGLIGALTPEGIGAIASVGLAIWLAPTVFAYAGLFQTVPVTDMVLLGSVGGLLWVARHRRGLVVGLASGVMVAWSLGWATVFTPQLVASVRAIAPVGPAGKSLALIEANIPIDQEVVAPNGSMGDFAARHQLLQFLPCGSNGSIRTFGRTVNFVVAPRTGVNDCASGSLTEVVSQLAELPGARLRVLPGPVYWVRWTPGPGDNRLATDPNTAGACPNLLVSATSPHGVASQGAADSGSIVGCSLTSHAPGLLVKGYTVELPPQSNGEAIVELSIQGAASVQVWDDPADKLVAQRYLGSTSGNETVLVPFRTPRFTPPSSIFTDGIAPFVTHFLPPTAMDAFELRIAVDQDSTVTASGVWLGSRRQAQAVVHTAMFEGAPSVN